jgi:hypothetical protein
MLVRGEFWVEKPKEARNVIRLDATKIRRSDWYICVAERYHHRWHQSRTLTKNTINIIIINPLIIIIRVVDPQRPANFGPNICLCRYCSTYSPLQEVSNNFTMKHSFSLIASVALFGSLAAAFAPTNNQAARFSSSLHVMPVDIASVQIQQPPLVASFQQRSALRNGIQNYMASTLEDSSTLTLSLKERPPPPTAEELAAKKRNFNLCG